MSATIELREQISAAMERAHAANPDSRETRREHRCAVRTLDELQTKASARFAAEHGLVRTRKSFSLRQLRDGSWSTLWGMNRAEDEYSTYYGDARILDHTEYYRDPHRPYRPAAIVAHLYGSSVGDVEAGCKSAAAHYNLRFVVLPWSWYYPERCTAVAYFRSERAPP
jgi:hypothetical protein